MKRRANHRTAQRSERASRRGKRPDGASTYARKARWLHDHGMWGFDVPEPKPWKVTR